MNNPFLKNFDQIFEQIITDYINQNPDADTSQGSLIHIKTACYASALWGISKAQEWVSNQIFPDTADAANMRKHAYIRNILPRENETDAQLLARLLEHIRRPPAGGNKYDYQNWALQVDNVLSAKCIPNYNGIGTVAVAILANNETGIPDQTLLDNVKTYIDDVRPVTAAELYILPANIITQAIEITVSQATSIEDISADIENYISNLNFGETLLLSKITAIAMSYADDITITTPANSVSAADTAIIRPGAITINEA